MNQWELNRIQWPKLWISKMIYQQNKCQCHHDFRDICFWWNQMMRIPATCPNFNPIIRLSVTLLDLLSATLKSPELMEPYCYNSAGPTSKKNEVSRYEIYPTCSARKPPGHILAMRGNYLQSISRQSSDLVIICQFIIYIYIFNRNMFQLWTWSILHEASEI